jgi:hypothetical protein
MKKRPQQKYGSKTPFHGLEPATVTTYRCMVTISPYVLTVGFGK